MNASFFFSHTVVLSTNILVVLHTFPLYTDFTFYFGTLTFFYVLADFVFRMLLLHCKLMYMFTDFVFFFLRTNSRVFRKWLDHL